METSLQGLVANIAPAGQIRFQAVCVIDAPKVPDKGDIHKLEMCGVLEFIEGDLAGGDAQAIEHLRASLDHCGRPAKVEFDGKRVIVAGEVMIEHGLVDESAVAAPFVLRPLEEVVHTPTPDEERKLLENVMPPELVARVRSES
jgi:hypothetical protein